MTRYSIYCTTKIGDRATQCSKLRVHVINNEMDNDQILYLLYN